MGRFAEADAENVRARALEPSSLVMRSSNIPQVAQGNFAVAESEARAVLASDTTFALGYSALAHVLSLAGKHEEAIRVGAISASLPGLRPSEVQGVYAFAATFMELGDRDAALALLQPALSSTTRGS